MARSVGIFDGEVNRNWNLTDSHGDRHLLTLFHDCVTGARAAMLDYEEVPGSAGTTNVFNLMGGRVTIPFSLKESPADTGHLSILRRGLTGFSYECELNGRVVLDTTSVVQNTTYEYEVSMPATVDIGSRVSGVTWYEVHTTRKADSKGTLVHRRFRDFYALHEQVESLMKGHHLRSSLPSFPGKKSKLWTNHGDVSFVEDRRKSLEAYLKTLLQLPHVSTLDSTRAFLGMVGNLREFSVAWEGTELGATLKRATDVAVGVSGGENIRGQGGERAPPVITSVQGKGRSPPGVAPGDRLFKVNGESTELMSLEAAWSSVKRASRPVLLHFVGPILRMDSTLAPLPAAFLRRRVSDQASSSRPQNGPSTSNSGPSLAARTIRPVGGAESGGAEGQWGLKGVSQMAWPAWGRGQKEEPKNANNGMPGTRLGSERRQEGSGMGGMVGPFGNGAGARSRSSVPNTSRLFGDEGSSGGRDGGLRDPVKPLKDRNGGGSARSSRDWMPVMAVGPGMSSSSTAAASATRWSQSSQPEKAPNDYDGGGQLKDGIFFESNFLDAGVRSGNTRSTDVAYSADRADAGLGAVASAWPPQQQRPTSAASNLFESSGSSTGGSGGIGAGTNTKGSVAQNGLSGAFTAMSFTGHDNALRTDAARQHGTNAVESTAREDSSDDDGEEENPFA